MSTTSHPQPPHPLHKSIIDLLDPEFAAFYNQYIINLQPPHLQPLELSRALGGTLLPGASPLQPVAGIADYTFPRVESNGPDVKVRAFTPLGDKPPAGWPVCLYFHGGGWVLGNIDSESAIVSNLCARGKCVVVTVDYRLSPESPFPSAVHDAWEALLWINLPSTISTLSLDISKIATAGSSAGANLASIMCQRTIARSTPFKISLQLLSVPVMDNTATTSNNSTWAANEFTPGLPAAKMLWFREHYLPNESDWTHPEASPIFWEGEWSKLPTAVMVLGELDILREEGEEFARKLRGNGVKVDVHVMKGMPHPFIAMDAVLEAGARAVTLFSEALYGGMYGGRS